MELTYAPIRRMHDEKGKFAKGHPNSNKPNRKISAKGRRNISRANKKAYKAGRMIPPPYKGKEVVVLKDGEFIGCFESATKLAEHFGVNKGNITRVCRGEQKTYHGYRFFYEEDKKWLDYINK